MMPRFQSILTQFPKPHVIKPKDEPQIAPKPRSTIAPKRPESSPTKPPEVAPGQIKDKDGNVVIIQDSNNTGMTNNTFSDDPFTSTNEDESHNDVLNPEMGLYGPLGEDEFKTRGYDKIGSEVAPPLTTWMRPPTGTATDDGLMPGDDGYVDPHAETMDEWEDIDKNETGGFRPDGTAILHSDPDSAHSLSLLSSASQREEEGGNYQGTGRKHRGTGIRARLAANKTQGQSATILTE